MRLLRYKRAWSVITLILAAEVMLNASLAIICDKSHKSPVFKAVVHPEMKIHSSFVHNQVVSIIFFFCWTKKTTFWRMWITKQCQVSIDFHAMEVYGVQQLFGCLGGYLARWQNFHIWVKYPFKAHCHQTSFTCFCLPATIKIQNMLVAVRLLAWHDLMAFNSGIEGNMPICLRQYVSG